MPKKATRLQETTYSLAPSLFMTSFFHTLLIIKSKRRCKLPYSDTLSQLTRPTLATAVNIDGRFLTTMLQTALEKTNSINKP